jgi:hypothetical protein
VAAQLVASRVVLSPTGLVSGECFGRARNVPLDYSVRFEITFLAFK